jgi:hypothetical protein
LAPTLIGKLQREGQGSVVERKGRRTVMSFWRLLNAQFCPTLSMDRGSADHSGMAIW